MCSGAGAGRLTLGEHGDGGVLACVHSSADSSGGIYGGRRLAAGVGSAVGEAGGLGLAVVHADEAAAADGE